MWSFPIKSTPGNKLHKIWDSTVFRVPEPAMQCLYPLDYTLHCHFRAPKQTHPQDNAVTAMKPHCKTSILAVSLAIHFLHTCPHTSALSQAGVGSVSGQSKHSLEPADSLNNIGPARLRPFSRRKKVLHFPVKK